MKPWMPSAQDRARFNSAATNSMQRQRMAFSAMPEDAIQRGEVKEVSVQKPDGKGTEDAKAILVDENWNLVYGEVLMPEVIEGRLKLYLYSPISGYMIGGVAAKDFVVALREAGEYEGIDLYINCPGGDAFDGVAISAILKRQIAEGKELIVHIDGMCASAATLIALSGGTVKAVQGSRFMIHRAWTLVIGNALTLNAVAKDLEKIDGDLAETYAAKTGKTKAQMLEAMSAETFYTAQEAKDMGLVDEVVGEETDAKARLSEPQDNDLPSALERDRAEIELTLAELAVDYPSLSQHNATVQTTEQPAEAGGNEASEEDPDA